jgi:uncharacterized membrane protein (UPF0127 family)
MSKHVKIVNLSNSEHLPLRVKYCADFFSRLKGFTFRKKIEIDEGLILVEKHDSKLDTSIHMLFVWTDLSVFWVNSKMVVVDKKLAKSWRPFYASHSPAQYVIELNPLKLDVLHIGDKLDFVND